MASLLLAVGFAAAAAPAASAMYYPTQCTESLSGKTVTAFCPYTTTVSGSTVYVDYFYARAGCMNYITRQISWYNGPISYPYGKSQVTCPWWAGVYADLNMVVYHY